MTKIQADGEALRRFAGTIGSVRRSIFDGLGRLSRELDTLEWRDENFTRYLQDFHDASSRLITAVEAFKEQEIALYDVATQVAVAEYRGRVGFSARPVPQAERGGSKASSLLLNKSWTIIGEPEKAAAFWQHQAGPECAIMAQIGVIEYLTKQKLDILEVCEWLKGRGSFNPSEGMDPGSSDMWSIMEREGLTVEWCQSCSIGGLRRAMQKGDQVLVFLNAQEIWPPLMDERGRPKPRPDDLPHLVWVTGIDSLDSFVIMNDSGLDDGRARRVSSDDFERAWGSQKNIALLVRNMK